MALTEEFPLPPSGETGGRVWSSALDPVTFAREWLGFDPEPKQAEVLNCDAQFGILNCTRQWGKSTVCSIKALHRMQTEAESFVLVISPSERQSREFLRKTKTFVRKLGYPIRGDGDNKVSLLLPNGSRMVGLPCSEDKIRGFSGVSLLLVDEAAKVPDELYLTARPMIAVSHGDIWMLSTPKGRRGFFFQAWEYGGREWTRIAVPATECPRISPEFLAKEESEGRRRFREEYMCEFLGSEESLFEEDVLRSLIREDVPSLLERTRYTNKK
jgi:hypothetical protein